MMTLLRTTRALLLFGCLLRQVGVAHAQDDAEAGFSARAEASAPVSATPAEDATAAGTVIELRDRNIALESVADVLYQVPGARVTDSGGVASFSGLSLRGAELGQTGALLDTVPLTGADAGAFDLSLLPLSAFERIEVYRSAAPVWLADGSIGGVLRLLPARGRRSLLSATAGGGSFGRGVLHTTAAISRMRGLRPAFLGHVRLERADNDYAYRDDGQTRFDGSDDRTLRQQNADVHQGSGLMRGAIDAGGGRLSLLLTGSGRTAGVPGPLARPTPHVRYQRLETLGALSWDYGPADPRVRAWRLQLLGAGSLQRDRLTDARGELGLARQIASDDRLARGYGRLAVRGPLVDHLDLAAVATLAHDTYDPRDAFAFTMPPRPSSRTTEALALEPRVFGELAGMPWELRPSARLEWSQARIRTDTASDELDLQQDRSAPVYRVAGALSPLGWLRLLASYSTGRRLPSIRELFGDRMFQEANPTLRSERSRAMDAGAVIEGRLGALRGHLEARVFRLEIDDLIRFTRTSQYTVRPDNIARAEVLGVEAGVWLALHRHAALTAAATAMRTENQFGRELPLRPPLGALLRPELFLYPGAVDRLTLFVQLDHRGRVYLDDSNRTSLSGYSRVGSGASVELLDGSLELSLRVNNLLDAAASDLLSRPLPGRELLLSLTIEERLD